MRILSWANRVLGSGLLCMAASAYAQFAETEPETELRRYAVEIILFRYADNVPNGNELFVPEPFPELPDASLDAEMPGDEVPEFGDLPSDLPSDLPETGDDPMERFSDLELPDETDESGDPDATGDSDDGDDLDDAMNPARRVDIQVIDKETLTLEESYRKLEQLDAYQPVLWTGWTQGVLNREVTPTIPLERLGDPPAGFKGELQLYLSRFLHLVVDLTLTPGGEQQDPAEFVPTFGDQRSGFDDDVRQPGVVYLTINEDRIVKNGDLRYFDHPRFGLLAKVTRIEEAEPEPATDDSDNLLPARESNQ